MPSKKISDMTALTSTATDDEFVVVDTNVGETKRITSANLKTAMAPDSASASAAGIVELATDAEAQTGTDTARAITAANLQAVTGTETRKGVLELATTSEASTGTDTARAVTAAGVKAAVTGTQDMWIPAAAMYPTTTNGCTAVASAETTATRPDMRYLAFHQSTQQYAQFSVAMPKSWDEGTVTASFYWTHATAVNTDVIWAIQGVSVSDNDTLDVAFGTAQTVTDTFHNTAEDLAITAATSAITLGGSPAAGDLAFFQVYRAADAAGDTTNSTTAHLIGVKIFYTTDAITDA